MKVLIVEADRALGLFLQKGLNLEGHQTEWVEDADAGSERVLVSKPDLIVLDLSLPRRNGLTVLVQLQDLVTDPAVIVLSDRNDLAERIQCLNLGADDCVLKPFSFHELTARCRAILRRRKVTSGGVLRSGTLVMDLVRRNVQYDSRTLDLTPKEFLLLEVLLRQGDVCCSRELLMQRVWKCNAESTTNVVEVCVTALRKKLTRTGSAQQRSTDPIETVRGQGYRLRRPEGALSVRASEKCIFVRDAELAS